MKITCDRYALTEAFLLAASVAPTRSPKEVLQNVKVVTDGDSLVFTATDGEVGITTRLTDGVSIESGGSVLLPVQRTSAILRESSDENISIELESSGTILLKGSRSKFGLPSANPDEFPSVRVFEATEWVEVEPGALVRGLSRTSYATDEESSRYALGGVKIEDDKDGLIFVATDGRRLASQEVTAAMMGQTVGETLLIPPRAVVLIQKSIGRSNEPVKIKATMNDVIIQSGQTTIIARLVEGRYPNWRQIVPSEMSEYRMATVSAGGLQTAIKQAAIVTGIDSRGVVLTFTNATLTIEASTAEIGDSKIELAVVYSGPEMKITVDHRYVSDVCKVLNAESELNVQFKAANSPVLITTDDGYSVVIMPMAK